MPEGPDYSRDVDATHPVPEVSPEDDNSSEASCIRPPSSLLCELSPPTPDPAATRAQAHEMLALTCSEKTRCDGDLGAMQPSPFMVSVACSTYATTVDGPLGSSYLGASSLLYPSAGHPDTPMIVRCHDFPSPPAIGDSRTTKHSSLPQRIRTYRPPCQCKGCQNGHGLFESSLLLASKINVQGLLERYTEESHQLIVFLKEENVNARN